MLTPDAPKNFCDHLLRIFLKERLILFAGAGVGVRAGLPDWDGFVSHLISVAARYEQATASIMQTRLRDEKHADAISYYKMCPLIPEGEKYRELAAPFHPQKYYSTRLVQLVKLPFSFIVTTNYDRSLHDAWAKANGNAPLNFEYDDESLKQAAYCTDSFIARIHGRAERADYMVADLADYAKLDSNARYKDFLLQNVLVRQTCLFLGYSFVDPAIAKILDLLEKLVGPTYPKKHYALLPSTANRLQSRLAPFNIEVILYPNHDVLWKCIDDLPDNLVEARKPIPPKPLTPLPFEKIRTFLASCYVRYKTAAAAAPLRDLVLQGIVLSLLEAEKPSLPVRRLIAELRRVIPLTETEASVVVSNAVRSLSDKGWVSTEAEIVTLTKEPEKSLDKNLQILVSGALSRLVVREAAPVKESYGDAVRQALEQIFLQRGSDLGAEFIGKPGRDVADVYDVLRQSLRGFLPNESFERMDRLARAVHDLLRRPDSREATVLSEVARLSFGLNVLLQSGSSALKFGALPERLYFDSNILLCAITDGHPFRPLYVTTFQKLEDATALTGRACELLVAEEFLNEIVSHRRLGIRMIKELGLEDPEKLEKHIRYYNAENTNVFVGAYASWVGRKPEKVSFAEFLEQAAPYDNEKELGRFMEKLGFRTVRISQQSVEFHALQDDFHRRLSDAYAKWKIRSGFERKESILIEHEARQLAQIELELRVGRLSYFVTADNALREILNVVRPGIVWNVVISNFGFVELVDLLLGLDVDPPSFARFVWGIIELDEKAHFRNYFIDVAVKTQDEATLMALPEILDSLVGEAQKVAKEWRVRFFTKKVKDKAKGARFLDRLEDEFHAKMAEALERRRRQERGI